MSDNTRAENEKFILAALIEIYRGNEVSMPQFDPQLETDILRDVFSSAISFARQDESRHVLSNEIFKCLNEGCSVQGQRELADSQSPDVLQAKMFAAAHLIKIMEQSRIKLS